MATGSDSPIDRLWEEYRTVFNDFDDLSLARWMAQTLGQLQGRIWRLSHPLLATYRLTAQVAHDRQIWLKRLATAPGTYSLAPCCRAPLLPLFTRDVVDCGLVCQHCGETAVPWDEVDPDIRASIEPWAKDYGAIHAVAHWEDDRRKSVSNYDQTFEKAAKQAEQLLALAGAKIMPQFLEHFPAAVWEDQDECLEVRPEDILFDNLTE